MSAVPALRIALVGLGRANAARQQALQAGDVPGVALAATVSRRPGQGSHPWQQVLDDPCIAAVAIGTENASHAGLAAAALRAGKHVLVDFPLAASAPEAAALVALAEACDRVLQCEHIGLLTASHAALRRAVADDPLTSVTLHFSAGLEGWLRDEALAGRHGNLAFARLAQLDDLAGPLQWRGGEVQPTDQGYRAVLHLEGPAATATLIETRASGLARGARWQGQHRSGRPLTEPPPGPPKGLFARDLVLFRDAVRGLHAPLPPLAAVLRVLALGDALAAV